MAGPQSGSQYGPVNQGDRVACGGAYTRARTDVVTTAGRLIEFTRMDGRRELPPALRGKGG